MPVRRIAVAATAVAAISPAPSAAAAAAPIPAAEASPTPTQARTAGGWVCGAWDQSADRGRTPTPDAAGTVFPVVTIHGITGSDDDFAGTIDQSYIGANPQPPRSLTDALAGARTGDLPPGLPGVAVFSFSYTPDSLRWVDNDAVGAKFAETIDCLHDRFSAPVSVVAHSMGGLVTRWVANTTDSNGTPRSEKLGKVITLGTPYQGSVVSSVGNGVTDVAAGTLDAAVVGPLGEALRLLNLLCGDAGTNSGKGNCGPIPLYASARSEAGRNLRIGSDALAALRPWPAGVDITTVAGSQLLPLSLIGSTRNTRIDAGDLAVATSSAVADPPGAEAGTEAVFTCAYDTATDSIKNRFAAVFKLSDPIARRRELTGALLASPCYHSKLMRNVELTNEVLGQLNDWLGVHRVRAAPGWDEIKGASIPAMCRHDATTLVDGEAGSLGDTEGVFELWRTLPDGTPSMVSPVPSEAGPLTAVVAHCNAGGVAWPNPVLFFAPGGEFHAATDLFTGFDWEAEGLWGPGRDGVSAITLDGDEVVVTTSALTEDDPECCASTTATVRLGVGGGEVKAISITAQGASGGEPSAADTEARFSAVGTVELFFQAWLEGDRATMESIASDVALAGFGVEFGEGSGYEGFSVISEEDCGAGSGERMSCEVVVDSGGDTGGIVAVELSFLDGRFYIERLDIAGDTN
jgi:pimeloyl-ACP methyl ester carboxylesterase